MAHLSTKSMEVIDGRMKDVDQNSLRYQILQSAKNFKTSWIELGQALYTVWKDRQYKDWGYITFDAYTSKEIGIKKQTALKLLKSYYFLEKEEPSYVQQDFKSNAEAAEIPNYESVNLLRLAKNKAAIDKVDYAKIKRDVLENGKDAREVKKDLTVLMRQRAELDPDEAREKRRVAVIRRLLGTLKTLRTEIETTKVLPSSILKETSSLITRIESEI